MRWAIALGGLLAAGLVWAEVPTDLNSPFLQTILIREKTGEITEKTVRSIKTNGEFVELEKEEGGLLVLPNKEVIAALPRLPQSGASYLQSDALRALKILQEAQSKFPLRAEVKPEVMAEWQKLAASKTAQDEVQSVALDEWLEKSGRLDSETSPEQLEKTRQQGISFLNQFPGRVQEIERELESLKELGKIDLKKIESAQFELGPLGENFVMGGVLWAIVIIPLVVALKAFSDAFRGFREGLPLAGILRFLIGSAALTFLVMLFLNEKEDLAADITQEKVPSTASRKAAWFCLNHQEKWANQGAKKITLPASDWLAFLGEKLHLGNGSDSFPFWHLGKPRIFKKDSTLILLQPVQAEIISLPFRFGFRFPQEGASLTNLELKGASVGKIPLGEFFGELVWSFFMPSYGPFLEKCGLSGGVRWSACKEDLIIVEIPATKKRQPQAKESLSARELAEIFDQGYGEIYEGKVITVEGSLVEVSSQRETMGAGTGLAVQDRMDEFILEGIPEGPSRRYAFRVRGTFKSAEAYFLDSKGDLFKSAPTEKNPGSDIPILRRRDGITKIRISAGRVESKPTETRLVTLYDCRMVEGFDGKEWVKIWGN